MQKPKTKTQKGSKPRLPSLKKLKEDLWQLCKQITRKRYVLPDGTWKCFSCGSIIDAPWKCHTGHCVPDQYGGLMLRYDLRNLRPQDYGCNINLGGNGAVYLMNLRKEIGDEEVDKMFELLSFKNKKFTVKEERAFLEGKIEEYKKLL